MGFLRPTKWKISFAILQLIIVGVVIIFCVWSYSRRIHPNPVIQIIINGPPGRPNSEEEAQKRVTFTIYKPSYKPSYINPLERLILFGNDRYTKVKYA